MKSLKQRGFTLKSLTFFFLVVTVFLFLHPESAVAQVVSPMQGGHFTPGVTNIRDMAHPPSGLFVVWYNMFMSTDTFIDRNGNKLKSLNLEEINPTLPNVDVDLDINGFVTVPAVFWASHYTLLGGARYMVGISPNYLTADATVITEMGGGAIDTTITSVEEDNVSGFTDLYVAPVGLCWGFEKFDVTAMYGFYAPVGRYETGASDNVGLGFWTHQFQGYGYYYPTPSKATAIMLGLTYELNGKIKDTDMQPGNRLSLEWGVSQYLSEQFEIGIQGGHNWQVGDDRGTEVFWDTSIHDRKSTVGFSASYWPWKNRLNVALKYSTDFSIRQRFDTGIWYINAIFLTNLLTGGA
jgi:hypothetical protein